jgi:serine protease Do
VNLSDEFTPEQAMRLGLSRPQGALVNTVRPNTPAARSGLQEDDVVLEFDGLRVEDDEHLIKIVGFTDVDKEVELLVVRQGKAVQLKVKLGDRVSFPNQ